MSDPAARARKYSSLILQRLSGRGLAVATALGVDESTVSRWKSERLDQACQIIALCGLKVVSQDMKCFPEDEANAMLILLRGSLNRAQSVRDIWEDDE